MLAIDCVKPSKSRLKLYVQTSHTSFDSVGTIMTMGGKFQGVNNGLEELILSLDKNFPSSQELPTMKDYSPAAVDSFADDQNLFSGYMYYFDIAPSSPFTGYQILSTNPPLRERRPQNHPRLDSMDGSTWSWPVYEKLYARAEEPGDAPDAGGEGGSANVRFLLLPKGNPFYDDVPKP